MASTIHMLPMTPAGDGRMVWAMAETRARLSRWWLYRQTLAEMAELSAHELADLGLHRSELKRVAYAAVYKS